MTKQEEIREGVYKQIRSDVVGHSRTSYLAEGIINYLHSQGVVIKVDRELPKCECCKGAGLIGGSGINDCCPECNGTGKMYCVGFVAIEPLVKDD